MAMRTATLLIVFCCQGLVSSLARPLWDRWLHVSSTASPQTGAASHPAKQHRQVEAEPRMDEHGLQQRLAAQVSAVTALGQVEKLQQDIATLAHQIAQENKKVRLKMLRQEMESAQSPRSATQARRPSKRPTKAPSDDHILQVQAKVAADKVKLLTAHKTLAQASNIRIANKVEQLKQQQQRQADIAEKAKAKKQLAALNLVKILQEQKLNSFRKAPTVGSTPAPSSFSRLSASERLQLLQMLDLKRNSQVLKQIDQKVSEKLQAEAAHTQKHKANEDDLDLLLNQLAGSTDDEYSDQEDYFDQDYDDYEDEEDVDDEDEVYEHHDDAGAHLPDRPPIAHPRPPHLLPKPQHDNYGYTEYRHHAAAPPYPHPEPAPAPHRPHRPHGPHGPHGPAQHYAPSPVYAPAATGPAFLGQVRHVLGAAEAGLLHPQTSAALLRTTLLEDIQHKVRSELQSGPGQSFTTRVTVGRVPAATTAQSRQHSGGDYWYDSDLDSDSGHFESSRVTEGPSQSTKSPSFADLMAAMAKKS